MHTRKVYAVMWRKKRHEDDPIVDGVNVICFGKNGHHLGGYNTLLYAFDSEKSAKRSKAYREPETGYKVSITSWIE